MTSAIETACAETVFAPARAFLEFPGRKSKRPMRNIPGGARTLGDNGPFAKVKGPKDGHHGIFVLPIFNEPMWSGGVDHAPGIKALGVVFRSFVPDGVDRLRRQNIEAGTLFNPTTFCLLLAKIAHAHLIAEFGTEAVTPLLVDSTGSFNDPFAYVGTSRFPTDGASMMHRIQHRVLSSVTRRTQFIEVSIQLFGAPAYLVAAGLVSQSHL